MKIDLFSKVVYRDVKKSNLAVGTIRRAIAKRGEEISDLIELTSGDIVEEGDIIRTGSNVFIMDNDRFERVKVQSVDPYVGLMTVTGENINGSVGVEEVFSRVYAHVTDNQYQERRRWAKCGK